MSDRPSVEFDGFRYQRDKGTWVRLDTRLQVPLSLKRQLDDRAQLDAALWERCEQQDFDDKPRNQGSRIGADSPLHDFFQTDSPAPTSPRPQPGYQSRHTAPRRTGGVDWRWSGNGRVVTLTSDIESGWRETDSAWCLRESAQVILPNDYSLRVTVEIMEDRSGRWRRRMGSVLNVREVHGEPIDCVHPTFESARAEQLNIALLLDRGVCEVGVTLLDERRELNRQLPWHRKDNHCTFRWFGGVHYECPLREVSAQHSISRPFQVQLSAVLHEPPAAPIEPVYERDTPFASAGLPTLGKKR